MADVLIKRELLERAASMELDTTARSIRIQDELRAILAQPVQQGEAVEVVGHVDDIGSFKLPNGAPAPVGVPFEFEDLMTVAQHQRILAASVPANCKVVPVELIERTICRLTHGHEHDKAVRELRAILEVEP